MPDEPAKKPAKQPSGKYQHLADGGEFTLTIVDGAQFGRTHVATSETKLWEGNAEQFRAQFEKL